MSHIAPTAAEAPAVGGVAGAVFPAAGSGAGDVLGAGAGDVSGAGGGAGGAEALGAVGEGVLPFTGSVFTAPIAILGLLLTFGGWALLRLGLREE